VKRLLALASFGLLISAVPAHAASFLVNDSFETGDFTGWITQDLASPFFPLSVQTLGSANTFGWPWDSTPTDGLFTAFSGFDGEGPGTIFLAQDVAVPVGASSISFDWRAAYDLETFGATLNRTFNFEVQPTGGGAPLAVFNLLTALAGTIVNDTGPMTSVIDISAFAGQNVRFAWVMDVPENFTGPAQLQLDNINTVPEPGALLLLAAGSSVIARRFRRARRM
jgi:hypothetical protein